MFQHLEVSQETSICIDADTAHTGTPQRVSVAARPGWHILRLCMCALADISMFAARV